MTKISVVNQEGKDVGEMELKETVFSGPINKTVMAEAVLAYQNNMRRGTAKTKGRGEVSGGGCKPWRQKGTGRARTGSIRNPIHRGGGVIFGPQPKDWSYKLPKKVKNLSICSAFREKLSNGQIKVLEDIKFAQPKTKDGLDLLRKIKVSGKILFILDVLEENVVRSLRNISGVKIIPFNSMAVYHLMNCDRIVTTTKVLKKIEEFLG